MLYAVVAILALAALTGVWGAPVMEAVPTQIVVGIPGSDTPDCGAITNPCRSIRHAARIAPPHSVISIANGTYECGVHVTVVLSIVALDSGVVLDCGGKQRGIFFDGVPAHVEGLTITDGYGEGAGGIVSVQAASLMHHASFISRCTFLRCTGTWLPTLRGLAGAVLIYHERVRTARTYSVARTTFTSNYARGEVRPAGGLGVWIEAPYPEHRRVGIGRDPRAIKCRHLVLEESEGLPPEVLPFAGSYYMIEATTTLPTYNSIGRMPTAEDGRVVWALYCERTHRYGLLATQGAPTAADVDGCEAPITGGPAMGGLDLKDYEYWTVRGSYHALLVPTCQDRVVADCPQFFTANIPVAQAGRHGLFTIMPDVQVGGRAVFRAFDAEEAHFVWYCASLREWIFTDSDPLDVHPADECKRGITSVASDSFHPVLVDGWKHWNNVTGQWSAALTRRSGGLQIQCQTPLTRCASYEIVNAPLDRTTLFHELETHQGESPRIHGRNIYASQTSTPTQYLSFCARYSEWMVHEENPYLHPEEASVCERTFSSMRAHVPTPDMTPNWAIGRGADWEASTSEFVCADGCSAIAFWAVNAPTPCSHCGDYVAHGATGNGRSFVQVDAPHHVMLRSVDTRQWIVVLPMSSSSMLTASRAVLIANDKSPDVMSVTRWTHAQPLADGRQPVYMLSCIASQNCSSVSLTHDEYPTLSGTFVRAARAVSRRATYVSELGAVLQYSSKYSAWTVSHEDSTSMLATAVTWAVLPTSGCRWERRIVDGKVKSLAPRAHVRCLGIAATRPDAATLKRGDAVVDSHFDGNIALSNAWDRAASAGGLLIFLGVPPAGAVQRGSMRNLTFFKNEAVGHMPGHLADGVGGMSIRGADKTSHFVTVADVTATYNSGDEGGGLSFEGLSGLVSRVNTKHNTAAIKGGAIAGRNSYINVSGWVCAHNHARTVGGCAAMGPTSRLVVKNSDLLNGSASGIGGVIDSQGSVSISASRVERMTGLALTGSILSLVDSQLYCGVGRAMTFIGGFGCVHDPAPSLPSGTTTPVVPIDATEAWWIWVANASSMLAQGMLSLTMAVFAIQYCMAHHLANVMPTARQLQASRWRASQRQLQQQEEKRKR